MGPGFPAAAGIGRASCSYRATRQARPSFAAELVCQEVVNPACLPLALARRYNTSVMRLLGLLCVGSALVMSCSSGKFKPQSPEPVVWVDEESHDFGVIPATETVQHVFTVKNVGGKPLNIKRVQTSCGCTAAVMDNQALQPGESTRLKVTFDPRGRRGAQRRTVWIHSDDPVTQRRQLNISATVSPTGTPAPPTPATPSK